MFLLDTNVVSELRKSKPNGAVLAWLRTVPNGSISLSAATLAEIQTGIERTRVSDSEKADEIENWLEDLQNSIPILSVDGAIFREWSRMMRGKSDTLAFDAVVAATARIHNLIVVTRNLRDFRKFDVPTINPFDSPRPS